MNWGRMDWSRVEWSGQDVPRGKGMPWEEAQSLLFHSAHLYSVTALSKDTVPRAGGGVGGGGGIGETYSSLHLTVHQLRTDRLDRCPGQPLSETFSSSDVLRGCAENEDPSSESTSSPLTLALAQSSCLPNVEN